MEVLFVVLFLIVLFAGLEMRNRAGSVKPSQDSNKTPPPQRRSAPNTENQSKPSRPAPSTSSHNEPKFVLTGSAYVIDGDSIVIKKTQVRLFGVDAPELNHPYGQKAKWALFALCKKQTVRAEVVEQDAHGRTVARCYLADGRDLSAEMVKQGLAIDWFKFSGGHYRPMELPDVRKKLWLADARQKGRLDIWERFEAKQRSRPKG